MVAKAKECCHSHLTRNHLRCEPMQTVLAHTRLSQRSSSSVGAREARATAERRRHESRCERPRRWEARRRRRKRRRPQKAIGAIDRQPCLAHAGEADNADTRSSSPMLSWSRGGGASASTSATARASDRRCPKQQDRLPPHHPVRFLCDCVERRSVMKERSICARWKGVVAGLVER